MNYLALVSIAVKYVPVVISFVQTNGPAIQEFVREVEAALATSTPSTLAAPAPLSFTATLK